MIDLSSIKNILVIKLRYIGDVLLVTPCLQAIKANIPDANVTMVVNRGTEAILHNDLNVDRLVVIDRQSVRDGFFAVMDLRKKTYDLVIDFTDGDRSAIMTRLVRARYRVGYNAECRWRGRCYDQVILSQPEEMHTVNYHLQALKDIGFASGHYSPSVVLGPEENQYARELLLDYGISNEEKIVIIHPGSRWLAKSWFEERYAMVADQLQRFHSVRVLFSGSEKERMRVKKIQEKMLTTSVSIVGQTTILQLAALMKKCTLFLGNDNGPMHIAAAMGLPVVAIFGPTDPKVWGPWGKGHHAIFKNFDCRTCFFSGCNLGEGSCMGAVSVNEVMDAVADCLSADDQKKRSQYA